MLAEYSQLSCWGIYLHSNEGPSFVYGAHDFYSTDQHAVRAALSEASSPELAQESIKIGAEARARHNNSFVTREYSFVTVTANSSHMELYFNTVLLDTVALPRLVTDCFSGEGLFVGDTGLWLGKLTFYPFMLSPRQIEEIYEGGATLADMSSGSDAAEPEEVPPVLSSAVFDATDYNKNMIIQAAEEARPARKERLVAARSPPAPHGRIVVDVPNGLLDDFGNTYTSLLYGPARLSKPDLGAGQEPRMLENVPSFVGSGMTLTFWYRHIECTIGDSCGVFLLWSDGQGGASAPAGCERRGIWSLWLETDGIWFDNVKGSPKFQYPLNFMPPRTKWQGSDVWRFISFTLDETSNKALLYMDGRLAVSAPWGSDVRGADCPARSVALGHSTPGWTYGAEVDLQPRFMRAS